MHIKIINSRFYWLRFNLLYCTFCQYFCFQVGPFCMYRQNPDNLFVSELNTLYLYILFIFFIRDFLAKHYSSTKKTELQCNLQKRCIYNRKYIQCKIYNIKNMQSHRRGQIIISNTSSRHFDSINVIQKVQKRKMLQVRISYLLMTQNGLCESKSQIISNVSLNKQPTCLIISYMFEIRFHREQKQHYLIWLNRINYIQTTFCSAINFWL